MKKILTILLLFSYFFCGAQIKTKGKESRPAPTTSTVSGTGRYSSTSTQAVNLMPQGACVEKKLSIVFYIVLDSTHVSSPNYPGIGIATPANLSLLMGWINTAFKPICVSFTNCTTVFIPNYNYGKTWKKTLTEPIVTGSYYTEKTLNFYLVDSIADGFGNTELQGYTYDPSPTNLATPKKDLLVMEKNSILQGSGAIANHLLGHYFGLPHTHDEITPIPPASPMPTSTTIVSQEFADGSNCAVHGDGFCDTEADPLSVTIFYDGMGNPYLLPLDNFMSYYTPRCRFTQQQYNAMVNTILLKRFYLH